MKRTDMIALAGRLYGEHPTADDVDTAAGFLCQIAQAQPVAWMTLDGERVITHRQKIDSIGVGGASASSVRPFTTPTYTLPLED